MEGAASFHWDFRLSLRVLECRRFGRAIDSSLGFGVRPFPSFAPVLGLRRRDGGLRASTGSAIEVGAAMRTEAKAVRGTAGVPRHLDHEALAELLRQNHKSAVMIDDPCVFFTDFFKAPVVARGEPLGEDPYRNPKLGRDRIQAGVAGQIQPGRQFPLEFDLFPGSIAAGSEYDRLKKSDLPRIDIEIRRRP